jgi:hypothetical protein
MIIPVFSLCVNFVGLDGASIFLKNAELGFSLDKLQEILYNTKAVKYDATMLTERDGIKWILQPI